MNRLQQAREELEHSLQIGSNLGVQQLKPVSLAFLSKIAALEGRRDEAQSLAEQSVAVCIENGPEFVGAIALGTLAVVSDDPKLRQRAVAAGKAMIQRGTTTFNVLHFTRDLMEVALQAGHFDELEHYAAALQARTRAEPIAWAELFVARARLLSEYRQGHHDETLLAEIHRLHDEALRLGFVVAAQALAPPTQRTPT